MFALQFWVARLELPAALKAVIVIGTATALLLASYESVVRYTRLGAMLNGPRSRATKGSLKGKVEF